MKLIIAGSRTVTDLGLVRTIVESFMKDGLTEVVCGGARGADLLGKRVAQEYGIPVKDFPARWLRGGKLFRGAGIERNAQMADYADVAVVIFNGMSAGSRNMVDQMINRRKPVLIYSQKEEEEKQAARDLFRHQKER